MSPIAIPTHVQATPASHGNGNGNGNGQEQDGLPHVHPTAARSLPGGLIRVDDVQSTRYDEARGEIRSVFTDRGSDVKSEWMLGLWGFEKGASC